MAILKFGSLVVGARGSIGGVTYSANRSGAYAKNWSRPTGRPTVPQANQRALFSTFGQTWRALDQADRDDWDTFAADPAQELTNALGDPYFASGWNWAVTLWQYQSLGLQPALATVPGAPTTPSNDRPGVFLEDDGTVTLVAPSAPQTGNSTLFYIQPRVPPETPYVSPHWRFYFGYYDPAADEVFDASAEMADALGTLHLGQQFFVQELEISADGRPHLWPPNPTEVDPA